MNNRIGVVAILVRGGKDAAIQVQNLLSDYSDVIIGRTGIPNVETGVNVISVTVFGNSDVISALCGKIGKLENVTVKSLLAPEE